MSRKLACRQYDITKVAKGLKAAGVEIANVIVGAEGQVTITTSFGDSLDAPNAYDAWKRKDSDAHKA